MPEIKTLYRKFVLILITTLMLFIGGCSSKLISAPGITGRFIEESSGKPIAGVGVKYTNVADGLSKKSTTDANGRFSFEPEFTYGYAGYPTSPLGLHVRIELCMRDKYNWASHRFWVRNTDVNNATINTGEIRVNKVFLEEWH